MKTKRNHGRAKETKNGLTSMIDIVFLLIFFFMVVTDLQSMEIEEVELPFAVEASPERGGGPKRIVVNVNRDGRIRVMGYTFGSAEELLARLRRAAADGTHDPQTGLPELVVKMRADKDVEYAKVQSVMVQCMRSRLWRVSFGTRPDVRDPGLMTMPGSR